MKFKSILEALKFFSMKTPGKLCLADMDEKVTYSQYYGRICGTADFLLKKGIKAGDKVVMSAQQTVGYLTACHAVQMAGGIFVPLEKNAGTDRVNEIIERTGAALYIGPEAVDICPRLDAAALPKLCRDGEPCALPEADGDSMILFTTGTTGASKGILLTHSSEVAVAENVKYGVEMKENNVEIIPMPMNHSFAIRRYFADMINGSTALLLDGTVFVENFFHMMDKYKATSFAMAPAALAIILKLSGDRLGRYGKQLDYIQFGSAPIPETEKKKLLELLPECRLYNIYGTTEAGCACVLNFNSKENRPGCIGRPTVNSKFTFSDENGRIFEAKENRPGCLVCSGGMTMKGYFNDPCLTKSVMKDGGVYSNDIGYVGGDGLIYLIGRADDVINTGGNKIAPGEIEELANSFPGVAESACVPVGDPLLGSVPKLFIAADKEVDTTLLYSYLSEKLEKYKLPKSIVQIDKLPRTYNGKIWRSKLKEA